MAEGPEHRPTTERANGGAGVATPCSPTDQWQCAPAPGPPQTGEEAGRRPLAPPRSPLTRCLVALSSCSKPRGRVGGRRGPCRVPSSRPSADCAHMATQAHSLSYAGCNFLRQRLVLSTLSGRPVKIRRIRARDDNPGLRDFEASFIRLLDKLTNGSRIEINQTGTTLYYQPGLLYGGSVEHDCSVLRGIGYYLEALLCLAPFMKHPLKIVLRGVTNDQVDPSVDVLKATALPLLKQFGIDGESFELKILRRGMPPGGGGEVLFSCPVRKVLKPVQLIDPGKIKRIRGMAYSVRVSPQMANRIVDSARSILNKFIPDIYIYTDHMKGVNSGKSPGFGLSLVAETTNGTFLSAELASNPQGQGAAVLPEDLGRNCAKLLLEEIYRGGCVDSTNQSLVLLLMTLGQQDVSKVLLGPLSPYTIEFLRHLKSFFQVMFKIETKPCGEELKGGDKVLMTCVGIGFSNLSKTLK